MIVRVDETNILKAAKIHSVAWKQSHESFCSPDFVKCHTEERQAQYLLGKIEAGSAVYMLIDTEPVGIVSVSGSLIEDLYVLPDKQNMGCGTQLLQYAVVKCRGTPTMWVLENNHRATALYHRLGFVETGRRKVGKIDEIELNLPLN